MKTVTVRNLQKSVKGCVDRAQKERIVVTRHGHPAAVIVGVEGADWEDVMYQTDPKFWRMIEKRRKEKTTPLSEVKKRLEI